MAAALATLLVATAPAITSADQATVGGGGDMPELAPGMVIVREAPLRISHFGVPNVAYADGPFVPGETVTATVTGIVVRGRFRGEPYLEHPGHAELLSSVTLTATVPLTWLTDLFTELVFDPPVEIRYQAPTTAALGCARHQGEGMSLQAGITADFAGSSGTEAWIDETSPIPLAEIIAPEMRCPVRSDFDGDGYADLAIGAPGDQAGTVDLAGAVNVLHGSSGGVSTAGGQLWTQDNAGVPGVSRASEQFGAALATGDFDRDGKADLAIGAPRDRQDGMESGGVTVLYGAKRGLRATGSQRWSRANLPGSPADRDEFGAALAAADFDGDGYDDLVVGVPGDDIAADGDDLGSIEVLYGGPGGLGAGRATNFDRSYLGPTPRLSGFFGRALAAGDLDGDGYADIAIGAPLGNSGIDDVGVLYGGPLGLTTDGSQAWSQASPGVAGNPDRDDWFGAALAAGDFDRDGIDDLAIGVQGDEVLGNGRSQGAVNVLYGGPDGLTALGSQWWHQNVSNVPGSAENHDWFGGAVAAGDLNRDGYADLAIGAPGDVAGSVEGAGAVNVLYGGPGGLSAAGAQRWSQASAGMPGRPEPADQFGSSLSIGHFGRSAAGDLAIGIAGEAIGARGDDGLVDVLYGRPAGLASKGAQEWFQDRSGVGGSSENHDRFGAALTP